MKLKEGDQAKSFNLEDISNNIISLEDYKEKKVLLSFYRYASCPLCNLRVSELIYNYEEWKGKGLQIIEFFQSPVESIMRYVGKQNAPFPIIADPERRVYKEYGIEGSWYGYVKGAISITMIKAFRRGFKLGKMEGRKNLLPADFLIENLIIKRAYYGKTISDHIPIEEIKEFLEK